jgi:uncharacterized membrane protein YhaH (DUF805 family)
MKCYIQVLNSYADFSGRSRRKEYWMFFLFNLLISIVLSILDNVLGLDNIFTVGGIVFRNNGIIGSIYSLILLVPSLAVGVRRLHDTNRSGWYLMLPFAPLLLMIVTSFLPVFVIIIGLMGFLAMIVLGILLIVFLATEGDAGENDYGPNPKGEEGIKLIHKDLLDN